MLDRIRIVLIETSHPGNIGGAARAMKTMGLSRLVLVRPGRYPDAQADWRAAGAQDVLDGARVVDDLDAAIAGCHWVVGTSGRQRSIPWPVASAREVAEMARAHPADVEMAVLFGREDNGLNNEELQRCHIHLSIPASPVYPVLNLAMAVQVVAYELHQASTQMSMAGSWDRPWATTEQLEGMLAHLDRVLTESGFLDANSPGQAPVRLRRLFTRMQLDDTEVQMMRGILRHLGSDRALQPGPSGDDGDGG